MVMVNCHAFLVVCLGFLISKDHFGRHSSSVSSSLPTFSDHLCSLSPLPAPPPDPRLIREPTYTNIIKTNYHNFHH